MIIVNQKVLEELVKKNKQYCCKGKNADYIPALAKINPNQLGITLYNIKTNETLSVGDSSVRFAIESISKVPALLLAIEDNGLSNVLKHINTEATGFAFNSPLNMEINHAKHPLNPFVNIGAIETTSLIKGNSPDDCYRRLLTFIKEICHDNAISLNEEIYQSESKTGDINRSLAYYLKGNNMLSKDVEGVLEVYFKQCSLNVTTQNIAMMASVLANKGMKPWDNKRLISEESATLVKSVMTTAGLYDESGEFSAHVGIPGKSGVGGGLMGVAPNQFGLGIFSPPLDPSGNSLAGIKLLKDVVDELHLNIFD